MKFLLESLFVILLISVCYADESEPTTYYISSTYTGNSTDGSESNPFVSFAAALNAAQNNSVTDLTLVVAGGEYSGVNNTELTLAFDMVTIEANGSVVINCNETGTSEYGFLFANSSSVELSSTNDSNSFVFNNCGSSLRFTNVTEVQVSNSRFNSGLYGIYAPDGSVNLLLVNYTVFNCSTYGISANGTMSENSQFEADNLNFTISGFEINNFNQSIVDYNRFSNIKGPNSISVIGGGWDINNLVVSASTAFSFTNASAVSFAHSSFSGSTNTNSGGAIYVTGSVGVDIQNTNFTSCSSSDDGGALYQNGGSIYVRNTNFTGCSARYGGAIYLDGLVAPTFFGDVIFTNNTVAQNGSCIACCNSATPCSEANSTVVDVYESSIYIYGDSTAANITCATGVATQTSGFVSTNYSPESAGSSSGAEWWVWLILAIVLLAIILAVVAGIAYFILQRKRSSYQTVE